MSHINICDLGNLSPGLNIEGGLPYQNLIQNNINKTIIWANIIMIFDRPLIDNVLFRDLDKKMKENEYPLLENTIDEINEHKMFAIYLMIIGYYISNCRRLTSKLNNENINITIHIHQDENSINLLYQIKYFVSMLYKFYTLDLTNINLDYRTDIYTFISTNHDYNDTDILISLSQCAGLSKYYNPGDMILADTFIPYNVTEKKIYLNKKYKVDNHLLKIINDIINSQYNLFSVNFVNNNYTSKNGLKNNNKATIITENDFFVFPILQVDDLWNPEDNNEMIELV
ncbi:hypothetical protein QKU48_gp0499 [Fadolivirus algeromassiliense]|jgi:hypothetical protein|uniref:Uncharacterized protein n=1 Tax=Fadolivirus FV1/VV64 TaxID=3070911 RepID=A0A7D3V8R0_9VIRU|nr:hypothetical protein QKU48_gp0499 [Fadolivirus algeromassiliense]QKF93957.1 hypothetical protein Fadolivirus_1_499 [Fadolivirus FV1/VV64]